MSAKPNPFELLTQEQRLTKTRQWAQQRNLLARTHARQSERRFSGDRLSGFGSFA